MTENQKKIFSLLAAAALTSLIVAIWFFWGDDSREKSSVQESESRLSSFHPLQIIKEEFSKAFAGFGDEADIVATSTTFEIIEATGTILRSEATGGQATTTN